MNTLVEKMFGIIMFLAMFVPFQLGLYTSYMATWEFTQVTDEITQLVKENGGLTGSAKTYKDQLTADGYTIKVKNKTDGNVDLSNGTKGIQDVGDVLTVDVRKNKTAVYNWKPDLHRENIQVTVYRR